MTILKSFLESFIPLFVAIDPLGLLAIFLGVTQGMPIPQRRRVTFQAVGAALVIAIAFMFLGNAIFHFLAIDTADFKIAGGIILLVLAVLDLLLTGKPAVHETEMIGIVPLAMPLIAGPATLTTTLVLATRDGYATTALSLAVNFALLLLVLSPPPHRPPRRPEHPPRLQQAGHGPPGRHRRQFHPLRHHPGCPGPAPVEAVSHANKLVINPDAVCRVARRLQAPPFRPQPFQLPVTGRRRPRPGGRPSDSSPDAVADQGSPVTSFSANRSYGLLGRAVRPVS